MDEIKLSSPLEGELSAQPTEGGTSHGPRSKPLKWYLLLPPLALSLLFEVLKSNSALMGRWVTDCMAPVMQTVGRFWAIFPFSAAEVLTVLFLAGSLLWLVRTAILLVREKRWKPFLRRVLAFCCVLAWLWTAFCWLWNCTYYAPGFAAKHGLSKAPYAPEDLLTVTVYFTLRAAELSDDVPRNEDLSFAVTPDEAFERGLSVYDTLSGIYPDLALSSRKAKPLACSRLQSIFGYTGIYFPFTGEANVNVDQVNACIPFTIAHEMAHQRMVASEDECNFLGILACLSCDDPAYRYSGYLMGLIYLTNALRAISPELTDEIMRQGFTTELHKDWNDNYEYWKSLESPTQEAAQEAMDEVYDGYLKSQGQSLGLMSYSACVDLLVNYFAPML